MREHGTVYGESKEIMLRSNFSHIYVKNIGQILKGIEGKSYWQGKLRMGNCDADYVSQRIQKKSVILKKYKNDKVYHDCENQISLS